MTPKILSLKHLWFRVRHPRDYAAIQRRIAMNDLRGQWLSEDDVAAAFDVVRERLMSAGVRLR